jgi:hypothetical protein
MQAQEVSPPPPPDLRVPVAPPVQEIPIRPLVVKLPPERIVEQTIVEREPRTEPLAVPPIINIQVPAPVAPHVTVNVQPPERNLHEPNERVRTKDVPIDDTPYSEAERIAAPETNISPVAQAPIEQAEPEQKTLAPEPVELEPKSLTPDNEKINEPINFLPPEPAPQASSRPKMKHVARQRGRQRKYHQTIALLEDYRDGETDQFARLDEQMQRYYRREYQEYFGRDSKVKANQRLSNRSKATRTKRDSERRHIAEISRSIQGIPDNRPEELDAD